MGAREAFFGMSRLKRKTMKATVRQDATLEGSWKWMPINQASLKRQAVTVVD